MLRGVTFAFDSDEITGASMATLDVAAESVINYLIEHDVSSSRLEAKGFGESNPIADNSTEDERALNRRVELKPLE